MSKATNWLVLVLGVVLLTVVGPAQVALGQPEPYLRVQERDGGNLVELDVAARAFEPAEGAGPRILLVGAAHIGDAAFYRRLQYLLDAQDLVLFEGVGLGNPKAALPRVDGEERVARTTRRARLIAAAAVGHRSRTGGYPADLAELFGAMERGTAEMLRPAAEDSAGEPLEYVPIRERDGRVGSFRVRGSGVEVGPDDVGPARPGGAASMPGDSGIQRVLARTLGVQFQLDAMDYTQKHWVNCDVTLAELDRLMRRAGIADAGESFLQMMGGAGLMGALQGPLLGMLGSSTSAREIIKLVLIDTLGQAEALMANLPGPMGALMDVLLHERNDVVVQRLEMLIDEPGEVGSIGVFYGAAHLAGLEEALVGQFGYQPVGTHWITAMRVDMERSGMDPAQVKAIRSMVNAAMQQEMERMGTGQPAGK